MSLLSCDKEADAASKIKTLTNGSWKLTAYMTDYEKDGIFEENTYTFLVDCYKHNIYTFFSNGNLTIDEGPSKCNSSNPQTSTLAWNFQDNGASLQLGEGEKYTIKELNATTLKLKRQESYNFIYTIDIRRTYSKQ